MQFRKLLAVGLLALVTGCGGEPKPPPPGADKAPPNLDLDMGTVDGAGDKKADTKKEEKKDEAAPEPKAPSDSK